MTFVVGKGAEIEQSELPALEQLVSMGYQYISKNDLNKERKKTTEVLLYDRLQQAISRINPELDSDGVADALNQIREDSFPFSLDTMETNEKIRAKLIGLSQTGGLEPITVDQIDESGVVKKTVKLFDFDNIDNNDFVVTNQFELQGFKNPIYPDIILYVNGIPLVIIECKSPFIAQWLEEAVEQKNFRKYRSTGNGYERLMFYNHILVATCGTQARHGTISSDTNQFEKSRWSSAYPLSIEQVEEKFGASREQEILIAGMLEKSHLLDLLKNYVIYQTKNNQRIKIIAKHQQFRAVTKCAQQIKTVNNRKGGVIWHTQGSGKSYTMHWVAKQAMQYGNLPIIVVTDRRQLDKQIHDTFTQAGFPFTEQADHSTDLEDFIKSPKGKILMTTIQKFEEIKITTNEKIIVLVDEAQRSQYGTGAGAMDNAMPNGIYFGFSGTPIDREDKSTFKVFGELIDKYGFEESKADGATIPIKYVGRLPKLFVEGDESIDELFERIIGSEPDMTPELKEKLKREYVTKKKVIAEAPQRIKKIAMDISDHFTNNILDNGYKAMIVASSRDSAVQYQRELERIKAPPSKIIMDQKIGDVGKDGFNWDKYYLTDSQKRNAEDSFVTPEDPTKILIVVDMLLVGFDAPIVKVLYLDKSLREHTLLQAIARVNRPYDEWKTEGLIIDYYGITKNIQEALQIFDSDDIKGAWEEDDQQLVVLKAYHSDTMNHLKGVDRSDLNKIIEAFEPADKRDEFEEDFKKFSKVLNSQMYKKETTQYIPDFKELCQIRQLLRNWYEDPKTSTRKYAVMIQRIIDDAIRAKGISELIKPMEITYENFLAYVSKFKSPRARTALVKNKTEQVIQENMSQDPAFYEKLWEMLMRIINEDKKKRKMNAEYFNPETENEIKEIYRQAQSRKEEQKKLGFETSIEFSIYNLLQEDNDNKEKSIKITKQLNEKLFPETLIVEWWNKSGIKRKMEESIYDILDSHNISEDKISELSEKILRIYNKDNV
ncbi:putative type-1 restriction enzyme MjaXP R protein [Marine Group I thaumarchaeote SCGC AAA799-P11]|uniref:type I site-specific deoxyribonuclease n=1 Tax=Marine Group I thaumarchaeote SCGC AAA799-P11 TaxID=1502295 RepID=A0A087S120_9ARCH|nr:putative type-1 restriction enzyme MjaXP R protein [Marine Group I thaumarchaeote SCGC AAA799-P11]